MRPSGVCPSICLRKSLSASPAARSLREMIHYDNCGPQDFRTDEQVIADAEKTWDWCMSEH